MLIIVECLTRRFPVANSHHLWQEFFAITEGQNALMVKIQVLSGANLTSFHHLRGVAIK